MHTLWGISETPHIGNYFVGIIILKKKLNASFFDKIIILMNKGRAFKGR